MVRQRQRKLIFYGAQPRLMFLNFPQCTTCNMATATPGNALPAAMHNVTGYCFLPVLIAMW